MNNEVSLIEVLGLFKKRIKVIISCALMGFTIMTLYTLFLSVPQYSSSTQLLVNRTQPGEEIRESDIYTNLHLINTYKDVIQSPVVLDEVQDMLDLPITQTELRNQIDISTTETSQVFTIEVTYHDPAGAANITNTIAETFQTKISELMHVENVNIISQGLPSEEPVSPNLILNVTLGMMIGLFIGLALSFLLELLDGTVKSEDFVSEQLGWSTLGQLNELTSKEKKSMLPQADTEREPYASTLKGRI